MAEKVFWVALCWFPDFREFIELELGQTELTWAHKLPGRGPPGRALVACASCFCLLALSRSFQGLFCPEKNRQKVSWHLASFGTDFLENQKQAENSNWHLALG